MEFLQSAFGQGGIYVFFWLAAIIVFLLAEAATFGLVSVWFAGGSLAALIAAICGGKLWLQITLFLVVSALLLAALRPFVRKFVSPRKVPTNADRAVGQEALVTERIDPLSGTGAVKVGGIEWTARSENGLVIEPNTLVRVLRIEGAKVTVSPIEAQETK